MSAAWAAAVAAFGLSAVLSCGPPVGGFGPGADNADCKTLLALNHKCGLPTVGGLTRENCSFVLYYAPPSCQSALNSYLSCAANHNCRALLNLDNCLQPFQAMDIACANANATVTTGWDGNTRTQPRSTIGAKKR